MTIAKGFVVRKRINNEIEKATNALYNSKIRIFEKDGQLQKVDCDVAADFKHYSTLTDMLAKINVAISVANTKGPKEILAEIEQLKHALKITDRIKKEVESLISYSYEEWDHRKFNKDTQQLGAYVNITERLVNGAIEVADEHECILRKIQNLEDKLQEMNHTIQLDIDNEFESQLMFFGFI